MILITGAAGFVGSNIARALIERGHDVIGVDDFSFGFDVNLPRGMKCIHGDFSEVNTKKFDVLIHCATANLIYSAEKPVYTFKNNSEKTLELFKAFPGRIIYTSTSSVYGNPRIIPTPEWAEIDTTNAYDTSKRIAEIYLQKRGNYTTFRLTNVYGVNQQPMSAFCGVVGKLLQAALDDTYFNVTGSGEDTRDFTYVDDVAEAVVWAVEGGFDLNTEINLGTGVETSIKELVMLTAKIFGHQIKNKATWVRPIDGVSRRCLDIQKAETLLNWIPKTTLEDGLIKTIEWLKQIRH